MYVTPEQIQAANKANVEAFLAVANAQFAAFEKLASLQASAVKSAFEDSINNTRAMLAAANSAYDNLNKVAKQATEIAEANVAAATDSARGLAKSKQKAA